MNKSFTSSSFQAAGIRVVETFKLGKLIYTKLYYKGHGFLFLQKHEALDGALLIKFSDYNDAREKSEAVINSPAVNFKKQAVRIVDKRNYRMMSDEELERILSVEKSNRACKVELEKRYTIHAQRYSIIHY